MVRQLLLTLTAVQPCTMKMAWLKNCFLVRMTFHRSNLLESQFGRQMENESPGWPILMIPQQGNHMKVCSFMNATHPKILYCTLMYHWEVTHGVMKLYGALMVSLLPSSLLT